MFGCVAHGGNLTSAQGGGANGGAPPSQSGGGALLTTGTTSASQGTTSAGGAPGGPASNTSSAAGNTVSATSSTTSATVGVVAATSSGSGAGVGTPPTVGGCPVFPSVSAWNTDVSQLPVDPSSDAIVNAIGRATHIHPDFGSVYGIPFVVVPTAQPLVPVSFDYASESDPGPYPIPLNAPIEADSDAHVLVVESGSCMLYELWQASTQNGGLSWHGGSGAKWNLSTNATRPAGWTSADAAGLPVFPGLVRYEEAVGNGAIEHALRFTVSHSRAAYIPPATHWASTDTNPLLPSMGMRFRMKGSFDCSSYSQVAQVLCVTLKKYGMFVADNGADWYISGAPNAAFDDGALGDVKLWTGDAFEVVHTGTPVTQ